MGRPGRSALRRRCQGAFRGGLWVRSGAAWRRFPAEGTGVKTQEQASAEAPGEVLTGSQGASFLMEPICHRCVEDLTQQEEDTRETDAGGWRQERGRGGPDLRPSSAQGRGGTPIHLWLFTVA